MKLKIMAIVAGLGLVSCLNPMEDDMTLSDTISGKPLTKIVCFNDSYDQASLLVKFQTLPTPEFLEQMSAQTGARLEKLFPSSPGKAELEARFGLDRWYVVSGWQQGGVDAMASVFAQKAEISLVQYNHFSQKASDFEVGVEGTITKASVSDLPFNDPMLSDQWHYYNDGNLSITTSVKRGADINVKDVWAQLTCGDPSIVIAVVDEGVKYTHPDLAANMWQNPGEVPANGLDDDNNGYIDDVYGYNFIDDGPITWDKVDSEGNGDIGHATHCAGTIAAVNNNGIGVSGVAGGSGKGDGCRIMSCQIFSGGYGGDAISASLAIKYAADNGASIISCSYGYSLPFVSDNAFIDAMGSVEVDAIHYFESCQNNEVLNGNIAVFSAGNNGHPYSHYPGAFHDIISVTAIGPDYLPTQYTNYGPGCNIAAPGGEIFLPPWKSYKAMVLSTVTSETLQFSEKDYVQGLDYGYMYGTSMACPHVSGVIALGLSYAKKIGKTFDKETFKDMVITSANDLDQRLKGVKTFYDGRTMELAKFYHMLGTGSIDAWRLMMQIEGVPCLTAEIGREQWLDLSGYFGTASASLTYLRPEVDDQTRESLGLAQDPYIKYGRLYIHPTKMGSGKVVVKAVGGGYELGGGDNVGGMEISQTVGIVARSFKSSNQGWF